MDSIDNYTDKISQKLKALPTFSGVYVMYDQRGEIIYVGKAKNLKNRVSQYFRNSSSHSIKVKAMVSHVADFDFIITTNEVEALVLENNLIKKHKPHYNILLKDDKSYPYIRIDLKEKYPTIGIVRRLPHDNALYFGPFMVGVSVREVMDLIYAGFHLRTCTKDMSKVYKRPCLNHDMGRCLAPCMRYISSEDYHEIVYKVIAFLRGDDSEIRQNLTQLMLKASEREDFETAIYYRDRLVVLDKLVREQVTALPKDINADAISYTTDGEYSVIAVLSIRGGKTLGKDTTVIESTTIDASEAISQFIVQYYDDTRKIPRQIFTSHVVSSALTDYIKEHFALKVDIKCPMRGPQRKLVEISGTNARYHLEKLILDRDKRVKNISIADELASVLSLPHAHRIECYDISNVSGTDKVASMVVFIDGEKKVSHYRRFRIKTVEGANDFASMEEVLKRRVAHIDNDTDVSLSSRPDLIVIDGGKGQLSSAKRACDEAGGTDLMLVGLAKKDELIYRVGMSEPIMLLKTSAPLKLMQRIRDEAHRFAITYHRSLRLDRMTRSVLGEIDGIGDKKIKALYAHFRSLDAIRDASIEDLNEVKGISLRDAENIYRHFRD